MATRLERVVLELQDDFTGGIAKAAAATELLDRKVNGLGKSSSGMRRVTSDTDAFGRSARKAGGDVEDMGRRTERVGSEVDKLSGRMRIFADIAATVGPGLVPIGAIGIPAVTGLSAQLGFAALAGGTMIAAFQGVGDALKAVNKAALTPTQQNLQAAQIAMEQISPSAQAFVRQIRTMTPELQKLRDTAAAGLFPGLGVGLDALLSRAPDVERILGAVSGELGNIAQSSGEGLAGARWNDFFNYLANDAPSMLGAIADATGNVAHAAASLFVAFGPIDNDFASGMVRATERLDRFATGLTKTRGFAEFIDYVRTNGPQVGATFGAIANALLQIVEAAAPLGGPVLKALEGIANVIAAIADSDLGTPIFTGLAALTLYNRALQVTASLQAKAFGGGGIGGGAGGSKAQSLFGNMRNARAEAVAAQKAQIAAQREFEATAATYNRRLQTLNTMQARPDLFAPPSTKQYARVEDSLAQVQKSGAAAAAASDRVTAAEKAKSAAFREGAVAAGRAGAAIAALAVVTTSAGDSLHITNTASLALAGTMLAPGIGTGIGAAAGALLDLNAAGSQASDAITRLNAAAKGTDLTELRKAFADAKKAYDDFSNTNFKSPADVLGDIGADINRTFKGDLLGNKFRESLANGLGAITGAGGFGAAASLAEQLGVKNRLAAQGLQLTSAAAREAAAGVTGFARATELANSAITKQGNLDAYRSSLLAFNQALKDNGRTLSVTTEKGLANRAALRQIASSALQAAGELKRVDVRDKFLDNARAGFIRSAVAAGASRAAARALADEFGLIDRIKATPEVAEKGSKASQKRVQDLRAEIARIRGKIAQMGEKGADAARARIRALQAQINALTGKSVTVTTYERTIRTINQQTVTSSHVGGVGADGTTVPKTGRPYADRHHYLLADGEEVISNRYGQADRNRALLKAINANRLADGGTAGLANGGTASGPTGVTQVLFPTQSVFNAALKSAEQFAVQAAKAARSTRDTRAAQIDIVHAQQQVRDLEKQLAERVKKSVGKGKKKHTVLGGYVLGGIDREAATLELAQARDDLTRLKGLYSEIDTLQQARKDKADTLAGTLDVFSRGASAGGALSSINREIADVSAYGDVIAKLRAANASPALLQMVAAKAESGDFTSAVRLGRSLLAKPQILAQVNAGLATVSQVNANVAALTTDPRFLSGKPYNPTGVAVKPPVQVQIMPGPITQWVSEVARVTAHEVTTAMMKGV